MQSYPLNALKLIDSGDQKYYHYSNLSTLKMFSNQIMLSLLSLTLAFMKQTDAFWAVIFRMHQYFMQRPL